MKNLRNLLWLPLIALAAVMNFSACSSDDDNDSTLTESEARARLNHLWQFSIGGREYALSLAGQNSVLVSEEDGETSAPTMAVTYSLQSDNDNYANGSIFLPSTEPVKLYYRQLGTQSLQVSLDNSVWVKAKRAPSSQGRLTHIQAMSLLLSGKWRVDGYIQPVIDEAEVLSSTNSFAMGFSSTSAFWMKYDETLMVRVDDVTKPVTGSWEYNYGRIQADPYNMEDAYTDLRIAFGIDGNQYMWVSGLSESGASFTGFSYGSNFLTAEAKRTAE